jgi:hypothetical protein
MAKQTGRYPSYQEPKPIDKELTDKENNFITELVDNHLEAFAKAGYDCKATAKNRAKRLQRHLWLHIEKRIKERVGESATLALSVLELLMRNAESENVKLNAARDILSRAGYDAVNKQETVIKEVVDLSDAELDEQIKRLSDNVVKLRG